MARLMTAEDVAFAMELHSEGVRWCNIAHYVFGLSPKSMYDAMVKWGAR